MAKKIHECEDEKALKYFLRDKNFENINFDSKSLDLLWGCCQIQILLKTYGNHYEAIENVFKFYPVKKEITDEFIGYSYKIGQIREMWIFIK